MTSPVAPAAMSRARPGTGPPSSTDASRWRTGATPATSPGPCCAADNGQVHLIRWHSDCLSRCRPGSGGHPVVRRRRHRPAVILAHGFAADHRINWVVPGVVDALVAAGRRVLAPDARGHGRSAKPHDPAAPAGEATARDL